MFPGVIHYCGKIAPTRIHEPAPMLVPGFMRFDIRTMNGFSIVNPCKQQLCECSYRVAIMDELPAEKQRHGRTHRQRTKLCKTG